MRKIVVVFIFIFSLLMGNFVWGKLTPAEEKRLKQLEAQEKKYERQLKIQSEFKKSLAKGSIGRFQAVRIEELAVFILDTKEGHMWMWAGSAGTKASVFALQYQGRVFPGSKMGEVIDSFTTNIPSKE